MIQRITRKECERGVALISTLLVMTMLLALGMAIVLSSTTDTVITKSHRIGEEAFYAADTGLSLARRALLTALSEEIGKIVAGTATYGQSGSGYYLIGATPADGSFPTVLVIPDPDDVPAYQFYVNVYARAQQLVSSAAADTTYSTFKALNETSFIVVFRPLAGTVDFSPVPTDPSKAGEAIKLRYSIQVTGTTGAGGSSTVDETGKISINLDLKNTAAPGSPRNFSFSGFGAFFDNGDTAANSSLAAGTFSGPVHTNTHFSFSSSRNVAFRDAVSQVDNYIRYDSNDFAQGHRSIPTADMTGIDISSAGYQQTGIVPLPANNFSQEYAVINGTGITNKKADGAPVDPPATTPTDAGGNALLVIDASGHVTADALAANLRDSSNKAGTVISAKLNGGADAVYVSSGNGTTITGAGIYVQGNVTDLQLYSNLTDQVYVIKQASGKITTVTVSTLTNKTTISDSSGKSATFTGVPTDKSDPAHVQPGVSLFVNGAINSLRGGFDSTTGKNVAALASGTRVTITAQTDITITGDLTYANAVVDSLGLPVTNYNAVQNVLGLFTGNGNVNLAPNSNYNSDVALSLQVHGAIVAFNSNTADDAGGIQGSITYTGNDTPSSSDKWTLVGSRVQSKINNIGYTNRNIFFDPRFSGGGFRPPFFPGTTYSLGTVTVPGIISITAVSDAKPLGISWYREVN
jgi:hypothetical protein